MKKKFMPKSFVVLQEGYGKEIFFKDMIAGIIVGIVALPLSIALAIASGVKPEQGLFTAIIGGFLISLFGGSRVQIGGPTGAFVIIIYGIMQTHGYDGLVIAGIMAGILLIIFALLRLGNIIKYIPYPVTIGFTSGIALLIFTSQVKDFLGLEIDKVPVEFLEKIGKIFKNIPTINYYSLFIGIGTIVISIVWQKKYKKIPGSLVAIIVTTLIVNIFNLPLDTIGSKFGSVPNMLPSPNIPNINMGLIKELFVPALTIAILAGIESLLSAVVADGMIGTKHNSNVELFGQGIANIFCPIFGGIPATGAIARTATNIKNGGRTPFAGMIHSLVLLLIMLFLGKFAVMIPMATLAGILIIVAYNMSEIDHFMEMRKAPKSDMLALVGTFLLTVFSDLTVAIQFGVIISALLFMKRMTDVSEGKIMGKESVENDDEFIASGLELKDIPKDVEIFEINGPFFFGAASLYKDNLQKMEAKPKVLIIRMRNVPVIDATGLNALEWILESKKKKDIKVIISGINEQPYLALKKSGLNIKIDEQYICHDINAALKEAKEVIAKNKEKRKK